MLKVNNVSKQKGYSERLEWTISEVVQIFGILLMDWLNDLSIYLLTGIKITFYEMILGHCWKKLPYLG